jgi:hypothetical protein
LVGEWGVEWGCMVVMPSYTPVERATREE